MELLTPYCKRRIIDILTRKKTLKSILFLCVSFLLNQLAAIGKGPAIVEYCNEIQELHKEGILYHFSRIIEILYSDWSLESIVCSVILIGFFIYLIDYKGSDFDDLEVFNSIEIAKKELGSNKYFRLSEANLEGVPSPNSSYVMKT